MTKEEEQKLLAAAESGDALAMSKLSTAYYNIAYGKKVLFNKKSYREKYEYWQKKAAEAGNLRSIRNLNSSLATLYPSEADRWAEVYYRTLDLLLRKYKAIYCDENRKEEARSILAAISKRTDSVSPIRYRGKFEDTRDIGARLLARVKEDPRYRDDYEATHRPVGTGTAIESFRHYDMYSSFDYEHYASDENYLRYALIRPDHLDAFEKEVEELERTLPQREEEAARRKDRKYRDPRQELFGFVYEAGSLGASYKPCYIPSRYVVDVVEEYEYMPHAAAYFDDSPYFEGTILPAGSENFWGIKVINIAELLIGALSGSMPYTYVYPAGPMILVKVMEADYMQEYRGDIFAIPATTVIGLVDFSDGRFHIREGSIDSDCITEFVTEEEYEKDPDWAEYGPQYNALIDMERLIERLDLRSRLEKVPADIRLENEYIQKRFNAAYDLRKNGYPPFERGVMIIDCVAIENRTKTVGICVRVSHGKILKNNDLVFYDLISGKESDVFHVKEMKCNLEEVEEAPAGMPVELITDRTDKTYPAEWKSFRQILVKVKS